MGQTNYSQMLFSQVFLVSKILSKIPLYIKLDEILIDLNVNRSLTMDNKICIIFTLCDDVLTVGNVSAIVVLPG